MFWLERNKDFAVHRADCSRIAQGNVDSAVRKSDIVENDVDLIVSNNLANGILDLGKNFLCLLDPRAGRRTNMQAHLSSIDLREKILSQTWEQK